MIVKMVSYTPNRGLSYAYLVRPVDHLPVESTHQLVNRSLSTGNRSPPTGQSASMGFVRACPVHPLFTQPTNWRAPPTNWSVCLYGLCPLFFTQVSPANWLAALVIV
jgi:hypothetical protein